MDTYLGNLKDTTVEAASHTLGDKVNYDAPDLASVPSIVHLPAVADPLKVQYMLRKDPNGWSLYDIVVDGVSTMASYRDQFNTTMNNDGFDKLISQLKQKSASKSAENSANRRMRIKSAWITPGATTAV
jgi:phospholipid transport system substrate-binding protein